MTSSSAAIAITAMASLDDTDASSSAGGAAVVSNDEHLMRIFHYLPTVAPAVIFCLLYFLVALPITVITWRTRCNFMYVVAVTAVCEGLGYALRLAVMNAYSLNLYMMMTLFILLSPNALALVNYLVLGRVIAVQSTARTVVDSEKHWRIPYLTDYQGQIIGSRVAKFFFASDVLSFVLQGSGGGLMGTGNINNINTGQNIMMVGLAIQLVFFAAYTVLTYRVYQTYRRTKALQPATVLPNQTTYDLALLDRVFLGLLLTIILLTVRNFYRFIEFAEGFDGYLASHEAWFYLLDALLMFLCFVVFTVYHFGLYLPHVSAMGAGSRTLVVVNPISYDYDADPEAQEGATSAAKFSYYQ